MQKSKWGKIRLVREICGKYAKIIRRKKGFMKKGLVYVFTGNGKGKTSAAIGVGVRAALSGMKVAMVCWYKDKRREVNEYKLSKVMPNFEVLAMGKGFYLSGVRSQESGVRIKKKFYKREGGMVDNVSEKEHREAAKKALKKAGELIKKVDLLILDEVNNAVKDKLIDLIDPAKADKSDRGAGLIDLIKKRGKTHLILTGRGADKRIVEIADLVTEMKKVKHPFDRGIKAVKGLDY